jgi:hypothetical protein
MRCGVGLIGFGIEVGFVLVVFVEFVFFDVDYSVVDFDLLFRFVMVLNIFVEGAEASERRNVILFGAERGCFTLRLGNVLGESGGFLLRKFVMHGFEVIDERFGFCFGFRFGFEVGDFRLGIIASGESLVRFVAGIRA